MTPRQAAFVREYLIDLNATQAAIRAGYSARAAHVTGPRLLANARVAEAIQKGQAKRADKLEITADRVLLEIARLAFADARKLVKWSGDTMTTVSSEEIDDDTAAAVAEVSQTFGSDGRQAVKLRLHDKSKALDNLLDHLGLKGVKKLKFEDVDQAAAALGALLGVDPAKLVESK